MDIDTLLFDYFGFNIIDAWQNQEAVHQGSWKWRWQRKFRTQSTMPS